MIMLVLLSSDVLYKNTPLILRGMPGVKDADIQAHCKSLKNMLYFIERLKSNLNYKCHGIYIILLTIFNDAVSSQEWN